LRWKTLQQGRDIQQFHHLVETAAALIVRGALKAKQQVIGVIQVVDETPSRFSQTDTRLVESLAANAATAIENARLYEQTRRDAETKARLLQEVNHRVKNNLAAIIGLLYAERHHASREYGASYKAIMQDLIGRVQGLATVHSLLSATEWSPLLLSNLCHQVINAALKTLPFNKKITVTIAESPVRVTAKQATHLALIINELTTNTVKYGLQSRRYGQISVKINLADDGFIAFEFRDDGPGYPPEVLSMERYDIGIQVTQALTQNELQGSLTMHNDGGAVTTIRLKSQIRG